MERLVVETSSKEELFDITPLVRTAVEGSDAATCAVFSPHTTAGITIKRVCRSGGRRRHPLRVE